MALITKEVKCQWCGKSHMLKIDANAYQKWKDGALIQHALGHLEAWERELLISHTCNTCFEKFLIKEGSP